MDALTTIIEKHNFNQDTLTLATHALLNLSVHGMEPKPRRHHHQHQHFVASHMHAPTVRDAVIQSGAARVVVPSLYNHTKHLKLQLMTCRLLCNLAFDRTSPYLALCSCVRFLLWCSHFPPSPA